MYIKMIFHKAFKVRIIDPQDPEKYYRAFFLQIFGKRN